MLRMTTMKWNNISRCTLTTLITAAILSFSTSFSSGLMTITSTRIYYNNHHHKHYHYNSRCRSPDGLRSKENKDITESRTRREVLSTSLISSSISIGSLALLSNPSKAKAKSVLGQENLFEVNVDDSQTYPALIYIPKLTSDNAKRKYPVLIVLHGAGKNELDVSNLANIQGEHSGLAPSLIASGKAPPELYENFIVIAPYSKGTSSFYDEPRSKLLQFIRWACDEDGGGQHGIDTVRMDPSRTFLFGFSDGATLGIELMTTRIFKGGVFAAYGFTGRLPSLALDRLNGLPVWIFHSKDDVIFPVKCSDLLVKDLRNVNGGNDIIKYTRFDRDQEGFTGSVKGHSTGITASKDPDIYRWLLSL